MSHRASADFWQDYRRLPEEIRARADKQFELLKSDPNHGSLQFKKIGTREGQEIWSVRVTLRYRALAFKESDAYVWFWIGEHAVYEAMIQ
jgi:mRNA-degrading endonuclease RelE of RelBE toxin-antitoxin system